VSAAHSPTLRRLSERWKITIVLGVVFMAVGIVAIVVPAAASVGVAVFLGWVLLFGAIVQLFSAFSVEGTASMVVHLILTVLMAAAGIYLLVAPLKGTITLTVVLTIWFIATGVVRLITAFRDRGTPAAGSMAVSGGLAILLGILVAVNLPSSASWAIGLLVGLDFLCFGWVLIVLANAARKHRPAA
jgi:uncharacterized membrane protein HdeD (DUF308 family)